jgi:aminopeptidase N
VKLERDHNIKELMPIVFDVTEIEIVSCEVKKIDRGDVNENIDFITEYGANNQSYIIKLKQTKHRITNLSVLLEFNSKITSTLQGFYKGTFNNEETKNDSWFVRFVF